MRRLLCVYCTSHPLRFALDFATANCFLNVISAQGGDIHYLEQSEKLFEKTKIYELKAERSGYINEINTYNVGKALIYLGGGRNIKSDIIDHSVGFQFLKKKM